MLKKMTLIGLFALLVFSASAGTYKGKDTKKIGANDAERTDGDCLTDEQTIAYLRDYFSIVDNGKGEYAFKKDKSKKYVAPAVPEGQVIIVEVNDYWIGAKTNTDASISETKSSSLFDQVKFGIKRITKVDNSVKTPSGTFYNIDMTTNRFFFAKRAKSHKDSYSYLIGGWYNEWSTVKSSKVGWKELESSYAELQDGLPQAAPHDCDSSLELNHFTILSQDKNAKGETDAVSIFIYIPDKVNLSSGKGYAVPYNFFYRAKLNGTLTETVKNEKYKADLDWSTSFNKENNKELLKNTIYNTNGKNGVVERYDIWRINEDGTKTQINKKGSISEQKITDTELPVRTDGKGYDVTYYVVATVYPVDAKGKMSTAFASVKTNTVTLHVPGKNEYFNLEIVAGGTVKYNPTGVYGTSKNHFENSVKGSANARTPELKKGDELKLYRVVNGKEDVVQILKITGFGLISREYLFTVSQKQSDGTYKVVENNDIFGKDINTVISKASSYSDIFDAPAGMLQDATYQLALVRSASDKYYSNFAKVPSYRTDVYVVASHRSGVPDNKTCDPNEITHNEITFKPLVGGHVASYTVYRDAKKVARIYQPTGASGQDYQVTLPDANGNFNIEGTALTVNGDGNLVYVDYAQTVKPVNLGENPNKTGDKEYIYTVAIDLTDQKSTYGNEDQLAIYNGNLTELVVDLNCIAAEYGTSVWNGRFTSHLTWEKPKTEDDVAAPVAFEIYYREPGQIAFTQLTHKTDFEEVVENGKLIGYTTKQGGEIYIDGTTYTFDDDYVWYGNKDNLKGFGQPGFVKTPREYYVKAIFNTKRVSLPQNVREKNSNIAAPNGNIETMVEEVETPMNEVLVYPNPATEYAVVKCAEGVDNVTVFNLTGAAVMNIAGNGESEVTFDVAGLAAGTYFVAVNGENPEKLVIR